MFPFNRHNRLRQSLSAYVDGAISERDRTAIEAHLVVCETCAAELEGLRATSEALQALPAVAAPRSFALTPQMVRGPSPAPTRYSPVLNTAMRLSAASLAVALAAVMIVDRADLGMNNDEASSGGATRALNDDFQQMEAAGGDTQADAAAPSTGDENRSYSASTPAATGGGPAGAGGVGEVTTTDGGLAAASSPTPMGVDASRSALELPQSEATGAILEQRGMSPPEEEAVAAADAGTGEGSGGIGAVGIIEIVLALLLGSALGGAFALTAARRQNVR
jgi:hypothetical protein